ncbi:MAG TPA: SDR family NAD(P)-dependent oxidoreductase, partial [Solirubrobacteraceae bacterium]
MSEAGRVAVVTGAGSGIGAAVATRLIGDGWRVVLAGRRQQALAETAAAAKAAGVAAPAEVRGEALVAPTDVTDADAVHALFARVREVWGRVDLLFNNAG